LQGTKFINGSPLIAFPCPVHIECAGSPHNSATLDILRYHCFSQPLKGRSMQSTLPFQSGTAAGTEDLCRSAAGKIFLAVGATAFVALCAHISIPLYFTPVPITLQTLAVLLVGFVLGPALSFSALALYLAEGACGLPVFSPHGLGGIAQLLGPTGGYLLSYPLAAAAAGRFVRLVCTAKFQFPAVILAGFAASFIIFATGAGWIAHLFHIAPSAAWHLGVAPFLPGELLKIAAAAGIYTKLRNWRLS
jgi:biotin transport system substrate-specific component